MKLVFSVAEEFRLVSTLISGESSSNKAAGLGGWLEN